MFNELLSDGRSELSKGVIDAAEYLQITHSENSSVIQNIDCSDGTLILSRSSLTKNALMLGILTRMKGKPSLHINANLQIHPEKIEEVRSWIHDNEIKILHVTGKKYFGVPDLRTFSRSLIEAVVFYDLKVACSKLNRQSFERPHNETHG